MTLKCKIVVGGIYPTKYGNVEVLEYLNSEDIKIKFFR